MDEQAMTRMGKAMRYAALGGELAGTVLVPLLIGRWADTRFGWTPWGIVTGAFLGLLFMALLLWSVLLRSQRGEDA